MWEIDREQVTDRKQVTEDNGTAPIGCVIQVMRSVGAFFAFVTSAADAFIKLHIIIFATHLLCAKFCYMLWVLGNTHTTEQKGSKRL